MNQLCNLPKGMLRLRFERLKRGIGQRELSIRAGVGIHVISQTELRQSTPDEDDLEAIAFVLSIRPARVLLQDTVVVHDLEVVTAPE